MGPGTPIVLCPNLHYPDACSCLTKNLPEVSDTVLELSGAGSPGHVGRVSWCRVCVTCVLCPWVTPHRPCRGSRACSEALFLRPCVNYLTANFSGLWALGFTLPLASEFSPSAEKKLFSTGLGPPRWLMSSTESTTLKDFSGQELGAGCRGGHSPEQPPKRQAHPLCSSGEAGVAE